MDGLGGCGLEYVDDDDDDDGGKEVEVIKGREVC